MFYAARNTDSYNKTAPNFHGTLVANWEEERALRDQTGEGRTLGNNHVNKKHEELFLKSAIELQNDFSNTKKGDQTFGRVFGNKLTPGYATENGDQFYKKVHTNERQHGKKHTLIEKQYLDMINQELDIAYKTFNDQYSQRMLDTTYGNEFVQKDGSNNVVGRRVMKDQNGRVVGSENRDEDLLVDHGLLKRSALTDEKELQAAFQGEKYETAKPYTFWVEKLDDGAYYKSKETTGTAPFTKNNEFLKTFHQYTHVKL